MLQRNLLKQIFTILNNNNKQRRKQKKKQIHPTIRLTAVEKNPAGRVCSVMRDAAERTALAIDPHACGPKCSIACSSNSRSPADHDAASSGTSATGDSTQRKNPMTMNK
jgi:hypothetical protein